MKIKTSTKRKLKSFFTVPLIISMVILLGILIMALFAEMLAPYDPNALDLAHMLEGPSMAHLLGTDKTGRDLLSRLIIGSQATILSAFGVVFISAVI